jgi:hypothetical protein
LLPTNNSERNILDRGFEMMDERTATLRQLPGPDSGPSTIPGLTWRGIATSACLLAIPAAGEASPVFTINDSLTAGDHYRVVFVTSTTITAVSANIETYNTFVTAAAAASALALPSTAWMAIGSTSAVNAVDNIACTPSCASDPIYLVNGTQVAESTGDLFDGTLLNAIDVTQNGGGAGNYVWTGSNDNGTASNALGTSVVELGSASATNSEWADFGNFGVNNYSFSVYAISGDLVVPGADVSAPAGASLFVLGGLMTFVASKFRRQPRRVA